MNKLIILLTYTLSNNARIMTMTLRTQIFFSLCHLSGILTYNHTTAIEKCRGHGGLVLNRHFINNEGRREDISPSLGEGESAWISGYVKFSKFVSWYGCFDVDKPENISKYILSENNIYNCLENCSSLPDILYIGLQNKVCYCIEWRYLAYLRTKPDHECKQQLIEPYVLNNGDSSSSRKMKTNVYTIIADKALCWKPVLSTTRNQCVYVQFTGTTTIYGTGSCFTPANGFICVNSASQTLSQTCTKFYPSRSVQKPAFCKVVKPSSWLTSFDECVNYSGQLVYNVYPSVNRYLDLNVTYWTGIFRSFKIKSEEFPMANTVCLSIKKVDNKLVLDPADCSTNKGYICEDGIFESTDSTTLKTTYSHKETVIFLSSATTMLSKDKETADGETVSTSIYIAIGVVLTMLAIVITVITCLNLRKRRKVRKDEPFDKTRSKDDHKTTANDSGISARPASVSHCVEQSQVLIHQHNESAEECAYATPHKALIQRDVPECEYDRVDLNAPGKSTDNTASAMPVDANIYGIHSGIKHDDGTGVYDHLHAVGTKQLAKPMDGIYNTTSAVNDTYNVLTPESKGKSTDQTDEKRPHMDETCATYDKLD